MKAVMFTNQGTAENNPGMTNWALISITDIDDAKIKQGWYAVHRAKFCDVDMKHAAHEREMLMTEEQALEIVDYVYSVEPHIEGMFIHCRGGVSRSAAIAKWVAMTFKLPFNHQYALFNVHVFEQLIKATAKRNRRP